MMLPGPNVAGKGGDAPAVPPELHLVGIGASATNPGGVVQTEAVALAGGGVDALGQGAVLACIEFQFNVSVPGSDAGGLPLLQLYLPSLRDPAIDALHQAPTAPVQWWVPLERAVNNPVGLNAVCRLFGIGGKNQR